ncbi:ESX-1 secretion-associated protein [Mycobacterium neumannii]|uniref:ESX-1 secretion-associated protein n=1 Tax=Mycobacterium neumannii TaxID=2048551 RepID=UPI003AB1C060
MSQLFAQTDGLRSSASIHDRVATDLSHVLTGVPEATGVQTSHGRIAAGVGAALSSALDARLGTVHATAGTGATISELLRKAAQMYEQGDHDGAEKLRAAAEALDGQPDTQASESAPTTGSVLGSPANGTAGPPGDQMVGQMLGQVGQQVGQLVGSMTAPLLGLAQGLQQVPQMIAQGLQQAARGEETPERDDSRVNDEGAGERSDEGLSEEPSELTRRAEPEYQAAPSDSAVGRAAEAPAAAEVPRPAQTRPQVG